MDTFNIIRAIGLILITLGVVMRERKRQALLFVVGGIFLEIYSIYTGDVIFIVLELVFIAAAIYEYLKQKSN